jgi:S1-C subfamily serine protease
MTETELIPPTDVPPPPAPRRTRRRVGVAAVFALSVAGGAFGVHQATQSPTVTGQTSVAQGTSLPAPVVPSFGGAAFGGFPDGTGSSTGGTTTGTTTAATSAQQVGIVEINTVLTYQSAQAAGTGMVLTSTGEVLTNNHVVEGATRISVTISSTGATYTARVVGTDPTGDVAVLQLAGASGLQTAALSTATATVGAAVTGVGNAGGTGSLTAAGGTITAVDQAITASDESGGSAEQLVGLIETDAAIQSGDSGGPLYGADGTVVGMDTAASSGGAVQGYAIPIATAEAIATQIEAGVDNATIHQGYPAFLGVSLQDGGAGATVAGVLSGGPAGSAGIAAGDVIVSVGGTSVTSAAGLSSAMAGYQPGDRVSVTWTTATGATHSATVTLATGPAD